MTLIHIATVAGLLLLLAAAGGGRRGGYGVNDLSRWKQFGGHLERPAPPKPVRPRSLA